MNISTPIGTEITSVNFGFYDTKDIESISVKQIVNPTVFDNLGHPTKGGLYDLALGPFLGKSSYILSLKITKVVAQHVISTNGTVLGTLAILRFLNRFITRCYLSN